MDPEKTRRWFLAGSATAGAIALAGCTGDDDDEETDDTTNGVEDRNGDEDENGVEDENGDEENGKEENGEEDDDDDEEVNTYEIWAADQGTDTLYIYEGEEDSDEFEVIETLDLGTNGGRPHMVHYSSDYAYAAIANAQGPVIVRTEDKEIVAEIETGGGSHFAGFAPGDDAVIVDVIGDNKIVKIDADLENEEFEVEDEIIPSDEFEDIEDTQNPVCHSFDHNGNSIHTLGPAYGDGGVVVVNHDEFEIVEAWPGDDFQANCGTIPHPTEDKFYLTGGLPEDPDDEESEGVGEYYVLDTAEYELERVESTNGIDAHGFWYTTDGEELWVLNRQTNDGVVIDPDTDDVTENIEAFGPETGEEPGTSDAPDIMWSSPDGQWMFVTLRGPEQVTGAPHAATGVTPGFSVINTETKDIDQVVEPDPIEDYSDEDVEDEDVPTPDFHGIGVRPVGEFDVEVGTPPF